ncbi:MAG: diaminopimelate epimerase [Bacteroidales bacterium]|nr:diaminopimelate epimerase [Bacteroidales bacterium]
MNRLHFYKYDGAGNDFVLLDIRENPVTLSQNQIERLCHRRIGIGADGLMTLGCGSNGADFTMTYYNSDGAEGTMCGNGGRCITAFAYHLGIGQGSRHFVFDACDGRHEADLLMWDHSTATGLVSLAMRDVASRDIVRTLDGWFLDTGSPHYVQRVDDLQNFDVVGEGRRLRHDDAFDNGANIDFIEDLPDGTLAVRTYERGVEDETWACGTGVTACALVTGNKRIKARGGDFKVDFEATGDIFTHIVLTGPVAMNFDGYVTI